MDKVDFGTTVPSEEECAQLGSLNYEKKSALEGETLIQQLISRFGKPPEDSYYDLQSHEHDYGVYKTVVFIFDNRNPKELKYANKIEDRIPSSWTSVSKKNLKANGYYEN